MVIVRTVKEFAKLNEKELKRFMVFKTGIVDPNMIEDTVQEFYVRLIKTSALLTYDEEQGSFDTYISNLFCWMLPFLSKKNFRYKHVLIPEERRQYYQTDPEEERMTYDYRLISQVNKFRDLPHGEEDDVFNFVADDQAVFSINKSYDTSLSDNEIDPLVSQYIEEFKAYIRRTESPKTAERMILFVEKKFAGCRSNEIAGMMGVSNNMVKIIKYSLREKYCKWQRVS